MSSLTGHNDEGDITRWPDLPVLVLSMHEESLYAERSLRAGAKGYITKQEATEKVLGAIRRVLKGEIYLSEKMGSKILARAVSGRANTAAFPIDQLSNREFEVFELIGSGLSTPQIAEKLQLNVKTIETYRSNIKRKLGLKNAAELSRQPFTGCMIKDCVHRPRIRNRL